MVTEEISYTSLPYPPETREGNLEIQVDVSENVDAEPSLTYRLRIAVFAYNNIDPNIFVMETVPDSAGRNPDQSRFVTVATPAYLAELPLNEPREGEAYFRTTEVDLYYRTVLKLETARDAILRRITLLLNSIEALTSMREAMTIVYEFDTDEEDSSSLGG